MKKNFKYAFLLIFLIILISSLLLCVVSCKKKDANLSESGDNDLDEYTEIKSAKEFRSITSNGKYILGADIDLLGEEWTPIAEFSGVIDGQEHEIRNMTITQSDIGNIGLVGSLTGILRNFSLVDINIDVSARDSNVGGVIGTMNGGKIENITVSGSIKAPRSAACGGLIGYMPNGSFSKIHVRNIDITGKINVGGNYGKIENLTLNGDGTASSGVTVNGETNVGGIAGYVQNPKDMSNLKNAAEVKGETNVGGIFGYCYCSDDITLSSFSNEGKVTATSDCAGGIFGKIEVYLYATVQIDDFSNTGETTGNGYVGGLFGYCYNKYETDNRIVTIKNSKNNSVVNGKWCVGGISGFARGIDLEKCSNDGSTITANGYNLENGEKRVYLGGYVGKGVKVNFVNCSNGVNLKTTGDYFYVGGIAGYIETSRNSSDLHNAGEISGGSCVGGIFGYFYCNEYITLSSFSNSNNVTATTENSGGLIGKVEIYVYASLEMDIFNNSGNVTGNRYVGGLFGYFLTNGNKISHLYSYSTDGNVCGYSKNLTIVG